MNYSSKKKSPSATTRSSPLLQFFTSNPSTNSGNASSPSSDIDSSNHSTATSSNIIRSLSKCFDGGVAMEDAILSEEERAAIAKARGVSLDHDDDGAQHQWGPTHSYTSEDKANNNNNNNSGFGGSFNIFKPITSQTAIPPSPSKSKGSHTANNSNSTSNKTDPTIPITTSTTTGGRRHYPQSQHLLKTGMMTTPNTPGGNSNQISNANTTAANTTTGAAAASGGSANSAVIANFWNNHARPANADQDLNVSSSSAASSSHSMQSPLSNSAKAAAEAVMGMFSKAEHFIISSTGVSPTSSGGGGFCGSPRSSFDGAAMMKGIPEEEDNNVNDNTFCGFEEFGFNAFQDNHQNEKKKIVAAAAGSPIRESKSPPTMTTTSPEQQPKGYEIRLKSTFSQAKAQKELQNEKKIQQPTVAAITTRQRASPTHHRSRALPEGLPFQELSVPTEIERSVSELTMRSHGAIEKHRYTSDSRRMAYYAVGRTINQNNNDDDNNGNNSNNKSPSGGNRRCYFTGNVIPYGMPFYAGSVQQGPRTLVVFCLPSALGLPSSDDGVHGKFHANNPLHRFSNKADREKYLESLPETDTILLEEMSRRYPEPFDTLPVQVRSPHCWRLFVKFCFFSGLPIAEGEMHYRVKSSVTVYPPSSSLHQQQQSEEIALSHEVMEAVNGEVSAEILKLPNQNLFDYLKRQYSQQSSKLSDEVFVRSSWEMVRPEV